MLRSCIGFAVVSALVAMTFAADLANTDPVIEAARKAAAEFTRSLPNYIVQRTTTRFQGVRATATTAGESAGKWRALDIVTADVVAENDTEVLLNVRLNGKPAKDVEQSGSWSAGEFSSTLAAILSPESAAQFSKQRATTLEDHPAYRYDYAIDQAHSRWHLSTGGPVYTPAYGGEIWIDKETSRVLRIEMTARDLPPGLPLDTVASEVDYGFVTIGGEKYLLPKYSDSLNCERGRTICQKNVTEFQNYRKYSAESSLSFDETPN